MPGSRRKSIYEVRRMRKMQIQDEIEKAGIVIPQGKILKNDLIKIYENNMKIISEYSSSDSENEIDENKDKSILSNSEELWIPGKDFAELMDVNVELKSMSNAEVSRLLDSYKIKHGPVIDTTRQVYMKKLLNSMKESKLQSEPKTQSENGGGDAFVNTNKVPMLEQYSCDDEEEEEGEIVNKKPKVFIQGESYLSKVAETELDIPTSDHSISYTQTIKDNFVEEKIETIAKSVEFCEPTLTRRNVTTSEKVITTPTVVKEERSTSCTMKFFKMIMLMIAMGLFVLLLMVLHIIMKKHSIELY